MCGPWWPSSYAAAQVSRDRESIYAGVAEYYAAMTLQNYTLAASTMEATVREIKKCRTSDPLEMVWLLTKLGNAYYESGLSEKAESVYRKAIQIKTETDGLSDETAGRLLSNLAGSLVGQSKFIEARSTATKALNLKAKALGPRDPSVIPDLVAIVGSGLQNSNLDRAGHILEYGISLINENSMSYSRYHADLLFALGKIRYAGDNYEEARLHYLYSLAIRLSLQGTKHYHTGLGWAALGDVEAAAGHMALAEEYYLKSLAVFEKTDDGARPEATDTRLSLALLLFKTGRYAESTQHFELALPVLKQSLGSDHIIVGLVFQVAAGPYLMVGDYESARDLLWQAISIFESKPMKGEAAAGLAESLYYIGYSYKAEGFQTKAQEMIDLSRSIEQCCVSSTSETKSNITSFGRSSSSVISEMISSRETSKK
jgi:tetratricopeptide (TPR) repeat protein